MRVINNFPSWRRSHCLPGIGDSSQKNLVASKIAAAMKNPEALISDPDSYLEDLGRPESVAVVAAVTINDFWNKKLSTLLESELYDRLDLKTFIFEGLKMWLRTRKQINDEVSVGLVTLLGEYSAMGIFDQSRLDEIIESKDWEDEELHFTEEEKRALISISTGTNTLSTRIAELDLLAEVDESSLSRHLVAFMQSHVVETTLYKNMKLTEKGDGVMGDRIFINYLKNCISYLFVKTMVQLKVVTVEPVEDDVIDLDYSLQKERVGCPFSYTGLIREVVEALIKREQRRAQSNRRHLQWAGTFADELKS